MAGKKYQKVHGLRCRMARLYHANRRQRSVVSYDCVEGGIANDRIFRTIDLFLSQDISRDEALKRLRFEEPNHQICFLKQALIDEFLSFIDAEEI
nr:DUF3990 domain-containing protein [Segatella maculosa]